MNNYKYLRIEHKHEPDVYFIFKKDLFYDFSGFNSSSDPVNPVSTFHRYYESYNELIDSIVKNIDYIKNDININKKQFIDNLVIKVEGGD